MIEQQRNTEVAHDVSRVRFGFSSVSNAFQGFVVVVDVYWKVMGGLASGGAEGGRAGGGRAAGGRRAGKSFGLCNLLSSMFVFLFFVGQGLSPHMMYSWSWNDFMSSGSKVCA